MEGEHQQAKDETPLMEGPPAPVQMPDGTWIIGPPPWYRDQVARYRAWAKEHPPTLEEVRIQFAASARISRALDRGEDITDPIKKAKSYR